jgi:hypothetical protein
MAFQRAPTFQINFQQGSGAGVVVVDRGVVLFPPEALKFRSRWDKTAYAWAVFSRDMRAPTYKQRKDRLISAVRLAA